MCACVRTCVRACVRVCVRPSAYNDNSTVLSYGQQVQLAYAADVTLTVRMLFALLSRK